MRRTGQTTNQIGDVIEMARGPQCIIYVWPVRGTISYPMSILRDRLYHEIGVRDLKTIRENIVSIGEWGSRVEFIPLDRDARAQLCARRNTSVVLDHACLTLSFPGWFRWMQELKYLEKKVEAEINGRI